MADDYWSPAFGAPPDDLGASLYYGPPGVGYVRILIAHAEGDAIAFEEELSRFLATCRPRVGREDELLLGAAGLLNGLRILHRHVRDARVVPPADNLFESLAARASSSGGCLSEKRWGLAHGTAGVLHALHSWADHMGSALTPSLARALARLAEMENEGRLTIPAGVTPRASGGDGATEIPV